MPTTQQQETEILLQLKRLIPRYREFPDYARPGQSSVQGRGLFAGQDLTTGQVVAKLGGVLVHSSQVGDYLSKIGDYCVQVTQDWYVSPLSKKEIPAAINHSCEPTIGLRDEPTFVIIKDVRRGDELTVDYGMTGLMETMLECNCDAPSCRGRITPDDWQVISPQYTNYLSPYRKKLRNPDVAINSALTRFLEQYGDRLLELKDKPELREQFYR